MKTKSKIHFYLLVALALAGFGGQAAAQIDSSNMRGEFRPSRPRIDLPTAAGSQCGWVGEYNGYYGNRTVCNGNTLAMGNSPVCPAGAVLTAYDNKCKATVQSLCPGHDESLDPCMLQVEAPAVGYSLQPATYYTQVTNWNCPAGYTITMLITGGGSNGQDLFRTCVKD